MGAESVYDGAGDDDRAGFHNRPSHYGWPGDDGAGDVEREQYLLIGLLHCIQFIFRFSRHNFVDF